jgi:hypothetical protein
MGEYKILGNYNLQSHGCDVQLGLWPAMVMYGVWRNLDHLTRSRRVWWLINQS